MTSWADRASFYTTSFQPVLEQHFDCWLLRRSRWIVMRRDGTFGWFTSWWLFHRLQWYYGKCKCNGSESNEATGIYIYTDRMEEMFAFRWRSKGPGELKWNNIAG